MTKIYFFSFSTLLLASLLSFNAYAMEKQSDVITAKQVNDLLLASLRLKQELANATLKSNNTTDPKNYKVSQDFVKALEEQYDIADDAYHAILFKYNKQQQASLLGTK